MNVNLIKAAQNLGKLQFIDVGENLELNGDEVKCPHCGEVSNIGGLIGPTTDDCPRCGERVLLSKGAKA